MSRALLLLAGGALLAGCASVRPQAAFDDVEAALPPETGLAWRTDSAEDARADSAVAALLAEPLTADAAVAVALLTNRHLQATYEDLGVAQAELVQAGLLANPVFGGRALWELEAAGPPDLGFSVAFHLLNALHVPLRRRVARSEVAATRARVAGAVLDHAAETRAAFLGAQGAALRLGIEQRIAANAEAAYTAARLLREAGTVTQTDVLLQQAAFEQARLGLVTAEAAAVADREALVRAMGLYGPDADIEVAGTLPPVPDADGDPLALPDTLDVAALEREAVEASFALAALRAEAEAFAHRLGLASVESALPELELGGELEREGGEWEAGPEVEIALPLFDQGQARRAAARAELRRRRARLYATSVDVRSATRVLAARLSAAARTALHYQRVLLPLRAELSAEALRRYNAMQTGVFGLLEAHRLEADAARRYADALVAYWTARSDLDALRLGRTPSLDALPMPSGAPPAMGGGDH